MFVSIGAPVTPEGGSFWSLYQKDNQRKMRKDVRKQDNRAAALQRPLSRTGERVDVRLQEFLYTVYRGSTKYPLRKAKRGVEFLPPANREVGAMAFDYRSLTV
jgi:hypothetical protein